MSRLIITADWVLPIDKTPIKNGAVFVEDSLIKDVGKKEELLNKYGEIETKSYPDSLLMPGFVNIHQHLFLSDLSLPSAPFFQWLKSLVAIEIARSTQEDKSFYSEAMEKGAKEALNSGITTIVNVDNLNRASTAGIKAIAKSGIRALILHEMINLRGSSCDGQISYSEVEPKELFEEFEKSTLWASEIIKDNPIILGLAAHAPYTCTSRFLKETAHYASQNKLLLGIHLSEAKEENELFTHKDDSFHRLYPAYPNRYTGTTPTQYLKDLGFLDALTLAVHCVQLTEEDIKTLADYGVNVAHCPQSNEYLQLEQVCQVRKLRREGITVGLGTDSHASNPFPDMFSEMRFAFQLHGELTAKDLVEIATQEGAKALGLEDKIGTLSAGKEADLIIVSTQEWPLFTNPYSALVEYGKKEDVQAVMVSGNFRKS